jgi:2-keto-4-pentenoate hydratase
MVMPIPRIFLLLLLSPLWLFAAQPVSNDLLKQMAEMYFAKQPQTGFPAGVSYGDGLGIQERYVKLLVPKLGSIAGYKVGLVTPAGQKRFGLDHPVRGVLLKKMLLPNGSKVSAHYGTQPILEADLIVRVKDKGINEIHTAEEAAEHLSEVITFIELADSTLATNPPPSAGALVSLDVGARSGILGQAFKVTADKNFPDQFGKMQIVLKKDGKEQSRVRADGVLGHPLNAVLWLVEDMRAKGEKLRAGEVLSLGSPSPQVSPKPGENYDLIYEGLPGGDLHATVSMTE